MSLTSISITSLFLDNLPEFRGVGNENDREGNVCRKDWAQKTEKKAHDNPFFLRRSNSLDSVRSGH